MSTTIKDKFGRSIYQKMNEAERYIISYYEGTDKIKMIIKLVHKTQVFELYARDGKTIYESENEFRINFNCIKIYINEIKIRLPFKIRDKYLQILKQKNKP